MTEYQWINERINEIHVRIAKACESVDRKREEAQRLLATKTVSSEKIN